MRALPWLVVLSACAASARAQEPVPPRAPRLRLVRADDGAPVVGAEVRVLYRPPWQLEERDDLVPWLRESGERHVSDEGGAVELDPDRAPWLVLAETAGLVGKLPYPHTGWTTEPGQPLVSDVRGDWWLDMLPKGACEVRVLDGEGAPVAGFPLRTSTGIIDGPGYEDGLVIASTDAHGVARFPYAGAVQECARRGSGGRVRVVARLGLDRDVSVQAYVGRRAVLRLPPLGQLVVRCGAPAARLTVVRPRQPDERGRQGTVASRHGLFRDGRVRLVDVPIEGSIELRANAREGGDVVSRTIAVEELVPGGVLEVELPAPADATGETPPRVVVTGRLRDPDGEPLAHGHGRVAYHSFDLDGDGRFRRDLHPAAIEGGIELQARAASGGPLWAYRPSADLSRAVVDVGDLRPVREPCLARGVVVDGRGAPARGAIVRAVGVSPRGRTLFARTDASGRFLLSARGEAPESFRIAAARGSAFSRWREVTHGEEDLELELLSGGRVHARVELDEGVSERNLVAALEGPLGDPLFVDEEGRRRRPFTGGEVEFGGLPEGRYRLHLHVLGCDRALEHVEGIEVVPGAVCDDDRLEPIDLRGRLDVAELGFVDVAGRLIRDATVWLPSGADEPFMRDRAADVRAAGDALLGLALHPRDRNRALIYAPGKLERVVELVPGAQWIELEEPRVLTLHVVDPEDRGRDGDAPGVDLVRWCPWRRRELRSLPLGPVESGGPLRFELAHPGPWQVRRFLMAAEGGPPFWTRAIAAPEGWKESGGEWLTVPPGGLEVRVEL